MKNSLRNSIPKLTWKETLGSSISIFKIKSVIKNISIKETLGPDNFISKFHKKFKEITKTHITRKLQTNIPHEYRRKILNKILNRSQQHMKAIIHHNQMEFNTEIQG